jgi:hypothetical protein
LPPFTSEDEEEEHVYKPTYQGAAYQKDNQKVFEILTLLLLGAGGLGPG